MPKTVQKQEEREDKEGVTVCAGNMSTPVIDESRYMDEVHYQIGNRKYIENAD